MSDYIKREDAPKAVCGGCNEQFDDEPCEPTACSVKERLLHIPSADVVERASFENLLKSKDNQKIEERKVGRWVLVADRKTGRWVLQDGYRCSVCYYKLQTTGLPTYCPNCGASMQSNTSNALDALNKEADTT